MNLSSGNKNPEVTLKLTSLTKKHYTTLALAKKLKKRRKKERKTNSNDG